jgi:hypothetical protein
MGAYARSRILKRSRICFDGAAYDPRPAQCLPQCKAGRAASAREQRRHRFDWLAWENAIPVSVSMPLREDRYIGDPVVAVFDNLLPDNNDKR